MTESLMGWLQGEHRRCDALFADTRIDRPRALGAADAR
jgi:hypothetical protein